MKKALLSKELIEAHLREGQNNLRRIDGNPDGNPVGNPDGNSNINGTGAISKFDGSVGTGVVGDDEDDDDEEYDGDDDGDNVDEDDDDANDNNDGVEGRGEGREEEGGDDGGKRAVGTIASVEHSSANDVTEGEKVSKAHANRVPSPAMPSTSPMAASVRPPTAAIPAAVTTTSTAAAVGAASPKPIGIWGQLAKVMKRNTDDSMAVGRLLFDNKTGIKMMI